MGDDRKPVLCTVALRHRGTVPYCNAHRYIHTLLCTVLVLRCKYQFICTCTIPAVHRDIDFDVVSKLSTPLWMEKGEEGTLNGACAQLHRENNDRHCS